MTDPILSTCDGQVVTWTLNRPASRNPGGDIKAMAARDGMFGAPPHELRDGYRRGVQRLTRAVYHCELALTGDRVDAATALSWGMVSEVVAPERLLPTAYELAARVAVNPPSAVRMTKKLLREAQRQDLAHQSDEHRTALARGFR